MSELIEQPNLPKGALGFKPGLALIVGLAAAGICGVLFASKPSEFCLPYLVGFMYWFNIAMGSLLLLMIQHLSGGAWGVMIRRVLESSTRTIWVFAIFFVPVLLGLLKFHVYEWNTPEGKLDKIIQLKAAYLNQNGFLVRLAVYFGLWILMSVLLNSWSSNQDKTADPKMSVNMKNLSGPGVCLFFLTMTFAGIDWILSLEPHYFSTMFGPVIIVGQALGSMAFTIAIMVMLSRFTPFNKTMKAGHFHDIGKFLLAFTMLWAYINISQFLITWSANLTEEVPYYLKRTSGGWQWVGGILILCHFILPFCALLSRDLKRHPSRIIWIAAYVMIIRFIDLAYLILPAAHHSRTQGHMDLTAVGIAGLSFLAVGGLWLFLFFRGLYSRPLIPVNDPYLTEAIDNHGAH